MNRRFRIVSDNVADLATITASNTAPDLGADWVKTDLKTEVCRILSDAGAFTLTWDDPVGIDCVAIPAWNGSASSEMRVRIYENKTGGSAIYNSGWQWAAPGPQLEYWDFSQALNVNGFDDGATVSAVWPPNIAGRRVVIDLRDPNRDFLDVSRIVVGAAFSLRGVSYGSSVSTTDATTVTRAASGDMKVDRKTKRRTMALNLAHVPDNARHQVTRIIQAGLGKRHFVSGFTDDVDVTLKQELMMYGVLSTVPTLALASYKMSAAQFQIEEW